MNQYTITPSDNCVYDRNGDMTAQLGTANLEYAFDYRDRLSAILDIEGSAYAESRFDSLGRRVLHTNLTSAPVHRYVFTASWQELEIFSAPGALRYSVAYGLYIDDVILHVLSGMALYAHRDDLFSARALTRTEGQPVERYEYTDFGGVRFSDADGNAREYSLYGFAALFTGRWLEYPANFVNYRMRYYEPSSGLFLSRDPGGQWYDSGNAGHARLLAGR